MLEVFVEVEVKVDELALVVETVKVVNFVELVLVTVTVTTAGATDDDDDVVLALLDEEETDVVLALLDEAVLDEATDVVLALLDEEVATATVVGHVVPKTVNAVLETCGRPHQSCIALAKIICSKTYDCRRRADIRDHAVSHSRDRGLCGTKAKCCQGRDNNRRGAHRVELFATRHKLVECRG